MAIVKFGTVIFSDYWDRLCTCLIEEILAAPYRCPPFPFGYAHSPPYQIGIVLELLLVAMHSQSAVGFDGSAPL